LPNNNFFRDDYLLLIAVKLTFIKLSPCCRTADRDFQTQLKGRDSNDFKNVYSSSQKYVPIDVALTASVRVRFTHVERPKACFAKIQKLAPLCGAQTVCIFTLRFTKNALQHGQKETLPETIRASLLSG